MQSVQTVRNTNKTYLGDYWLIIHSLNNTVSLHISIIYVVLLLLIQLKSIIMFYFIQRNILMYKSPQNWTDF